MLTYQCFTVVLLLIYGSLFLSVIYYCLRVFWCAATRMLGLELEPQTNIKFLVVSWCWFYCQVMGIMLWRKQQFKSGQNVFLREEKVSLMKRDQDGQQQTELKKTLQNSSNCAWKLLADCQEHSRASEHRQRNSQGNLNWRSWHEEGVCKNGPKGAHQRTKAKKRF